MTIKQKWTHATSIAALALPVFLIIAISSSGAVFGNPVPMSSATAQPKSGAAPRGVVILVVDEATTGAYTPVPAQVTGVQSTHTPTSPSNQLIVNPQYYGGSFSNHVEPTEAEYDEKRHVRVSYRDVGDTKMKVDLHVTFEGEEDEEYTITWNNNEFAASWHGSINLTQYESNGSATWRAYTYHPYDPSITPPTKVAVHLVPPAGGNPGVTEWEYSIVGADSVTIGKDSGMVILREPNLGPTDPPAGLAGSFNYTADEDGTVEFKDVRTALEVELNHSVQALWSGAKHTYRSRSLNPDPDGHPWHVYGVKLKVTISSP
jgi:hypothetical protein